MINISKCSKVAVVKALYDNSHPQGLGAFHYRSEPLTLEQGEEFLKNGTYFDYLNGRVMKVDVGGDVLDPTLYDRDNGTGAAYRALKSAGLVP